MWAKIDDNFLDHPKVLRAGEDAANLYLRGLIWCARHLTDGRIPREALCTLSRRRDVLALARKLTEVRLWEETSEGWCVHDFAAHNPLRIDVEAKRAQLSRKRSEAGKIGGIRSGEVRNSEAKSKQVASADASILLKQLNAPSRPVPSEETGSLPSAVCGAGAPPTATAVSGGSTSLADRPRHEISVPAGKAADALAATSILARIVRRPCLLCEAAVTAFPAVDLPREIAAVEAWLVANPKNCKRDGDRFLNSWLARAQEKAPRIDTRPIVPHEAARGDVDRRLHSIPQKILKGLFP